MTRLLVVEDNPVFREGAAQYFASRSDVQTAYAQDAKTAIVHLWTEPRSIDAAIIDCFFPANEGSDPENLRLAGELAVQIMEIEDPQERRIIAGLEIFGRYVDLEDQELRTYVRAFVASTSGAVENSPVIRALEQVSCMGREATTQIAKNTLGLVYDATRAPRDYYAALRSAIAESSANQPSGILVAREATNVGIPFVLATSTYHHDILTQPVQDHASRKGWTLIDCSPGQEDHKATPQYWARAMGELEQRMQVSLENR